MLKDGDMGETADNRTCDVCGEPVADALRGYMKSVKACNAHLEEWRVSPSRHAAVLERMRGLGSVSDAFDVWAAAEREARDDDGR